jgi:hypothetical protein
MGQKCTSSLVYSSSSTSGGNVGLFEHKVVLCSPFIFSMGLQGPVNNKGNFEHVLDFHAWAQATEKACHMVSQRLFVLHS